ncbi:hypothetical protein CBR_g41471 [Chara braunii]|uniref:Uncharacterized protein n=1 Tax=Chara braunii TaxID=69332 RepID=A0A388LVZ1_CHABU|nr:hypothetical protein CBR_g41471 [Chara braunii]|eukprot:GBG86476.1 hypothetical protein CBR_g41471 [Chara braunii]
MTGSSHSSSAVGMIGFASHSLLPRTERCCCCGFSGQERIGLPFEKCGENCRYLPRGLGNAARQPSIIPLTRRRRGPYGHARTLDQECPPVRSLPRARQCQRRQWRSHSRRTCSLDLLPLVHERSAANCICYDNWFPPPTWRPPVRRSWSTSVIVRCSIATAAAVLDDDDDENMLQQETCGGGLQEGGGGRRQGMEELGGGRRWRGREEGGDGDGSRREEAGHGRWRWKHEGGGRVWRSMEEGGDEEGGRREAMDRGGGEKRSKDREEGGDGDARREEGGDGDGSRREDAGYGGVWRKEAMDREGGGRRWTGGKERNNRKTGRRVAMEMQGGRRRMSAEKQKYEQGKQQEQDQEQDQDQDREQDQDQDQDKFLRVAGIVGTATMASKLLGTVRETALAAAFGVGPVMDAFSYASLAPTFFIALLGGINGPFHSAMASSLSKRTSSEGAYLVDAVSTLVGVVFVGVSIVVGVFAEPIIDLSAPGLFTAHASNGLLTRNIAISQLRIMAPCALLAPLIGIGFGSLSARKVYVIPSLSPSFSSLAILVAVGVHVARFGKLAGHPSNAMQGGITLAIGSMAGTVLQWLVQVIAQARSGGGVFRLRFENPFDNPGVKEVLRVVVPAAVGSGLLQIATYTDLYFASFLPNAASALGSEQEAKDATLLKERREEAKKKALLEEQAAKLKKIEEEMARERERLKREEEEKLKAVEEEEEEDERPLERRRVGGRGESSGTKEHQMEKKITEWVAGISLGEEEEALMYVPREEQEAAIRAWDAEEDPLKRQAMEDEKRMEWKFRLMRERKRRMDAASEVAKELEEVKKQRDQMATQVDLLGKMKGIGDAGGRRGEGPPRGHRTLLYRRHRRRQIDCPKEEEARPRREPVKVKFPDSYSGKQEENFDHWEANVKTYVHLQKVSPDEHVLIAIHALRDEAASFARSLCRAANCNDNLVAYCAFTPLTEFLKLLRERFADVSRSVKASDRLQTIHSRQWKSVRALKGVMDELVAIPDHGVTKTQLGNLFYRAMPEQLRGHFFEKSQQPTMTYDALSREVVVFEARSMSISTFWHKDLDKGKKWKGRTISGQVKTKDRLILTLDAGGVDEVPYEQIEWGLEEEDSGVSQGRTYAAVAAGGRPQGGGRGRGQGARASGGRSQGD